MQTLIFLAIVPQEVQATTAIVVISLIWLLFGLLAIYSNILRDPIGKIAAPFSLTKVQFGLWTAIISSVYVYLSLCKGDCAETAINKTALVLMGISSGTVIASSIIDNKEISDLRPRHQNSPSQGFFIDILSDENGISLHRFQNLAWTIIAMTVYLYKVSEITTGCQLPELSDTLLALTGISTATYIVMRTQENATAGPASLPAPAQAAVPPAPAAVTGASV
jgi:hypothetical protein